MLFIIRMRNVLNHSWHIFSITKTSMISFGDISSSLVQLEPISKFITMFLRSPPRNPKSFPVVEIDRIQ